MKLKNRIIDFFINSKPENAPDTGEYKNSDILGRYPVFEDVYDGEKTDGDLGEPVELSLDYQVLATRSWEAFLKTSFVGIVLERYIEWIIGTGLQLQSEPSSVVLETEGIKLEASELDDFKNKAEARFRLWASTTLADEKRNDNFHRINCEIIKTSFLSGDCLVIYRIGGDGLPTVDFIDGRSLKTPLGYKGDAKIVDGVELESNGSHIAYWVSIDGLEYKRIAKYDRFGRLRAELVCWKKARRYDVRGLSALHGSLNMLKNMDRYIDSTIESAVSQSNIAYFIEKEKDAMEIPGGSFKPSGSKAIETTDKDINIVKRQVVAETSKQMFDLPPGYTVKMPTFSDRTQVENFITVYFNFFCSALGIPPEVAIQLYTNSFSASRMATKGWEHTLRVKRATISTYKNAYRLMFDLDAWSGKINVKAYKKAVLDNNKLAVEAFVKCKLIGVNVPHADPVKEAKAHRILLGNDDIVLEAGSTATESLGTGEFEDIQEVVRREKEIAQTYNEQGRNNTTE